MIVGIGTDLFAVERMAEELRQGGAGFRESVFTPAEIAYCEGKRYPAQHYAARFAAKEAALKALGRDGEAGAAWRQVEIRNDAAGRPRVVLHGDLRRIAEDLHIDALAVSLSHTRELAVASVVVESSRQDAGVRGATR